MAASGQEREVALDLTFDVASTAAQEGAEPAVEAELPAVIADEVENCAQSFLVGPSQASPELLEKEGRAFRRPEQQQGIDVWNVDTLVEEIDREDDVDLCRLTDRAARPFVSVSGCRPRRPPP